MRITTIINQKGGVGKTTTAHALATGLRIQGYNVLSIDIDPQGNFSYTMNADTKGRGIYGAMRGEYSMYDVIQNTEQGDIVPSSLLLTAADMEFTSTGREWIIDSLLKSMDNSYSHVIIDSPPTLGVLTINALTASTDVVIPMGADIYSLQGLYQLHNTILKVKQFCNKNISIAGLLLTRYNSRTVLSHDIRDGIESKARELQAPLYSTVIREGVAVKEAQTSQTSLFCYAPKSNPALDYKAFIAEYLNQENANTEKEPTYA
ncbi:MAG: AAA family ATPase [Defluviitaleaceae bacterium]|nr:AAA family ATPase [Defluviitaleaceae bacterium]